MFTITFSRGEVSPLYQEFEIDTTDDLESLPTAASEIAIGSLAHCRANHIEYRLGNDREWYAYRCIAKAEDLPTDEAPPIVGEAIVGETTLTE